jgi:hypothetical protein
VVGLGVVRDRIEDIPNVGDFVNYRILDDWILITRTAEDRTVEAIAECGSDRHILPNSVVLPTADGAIWYRARPNGDDPDSCIFDIWSLGRYAPGQEPEVAHGFSESFEAFKGKNPFLEGDFSNMLAVHEGMKSRGWRGAWVNPLQEIQIANFHRVLQAYCFGDGWPG